MMFSTLPKTNFNFFSQICRLLMFSIWSSLKKKSCHLEKSKPALSSFPTNKKSKTSITSCLLSANALNWDKSKILSFVEESNPYLPGCSFYLRVQRDVPDIPLKSLHILPKPISILVQDFIPGH